MSYPVEENKGFEKKVQSKLDAGVPHKIHPVVFTHRVTGKKGDIAELKYE